ncbi:MAG: sugar kinase, partial [Pseudomonadota bacterium]
GPMRVPEQEGGSRLVDHASLIIIERSIAADGGSPFSLYDQQADWSSFEPHVEQWISRAGRNLAHAIVSSLSMLDFEAVVIDGAIPPDVKQRLVDEVIEQLQQMDLEGVLMPKIEAGQVGQKARTIGAAAALISRDYLIDHNTPLLD